jgi:hypothetical protein
LAKLPTGDFFNKQSGDYKLTLFVAGAKVSEPISYEAGLISLNFDSLTVQPSGAFQPLPEIQHVFRAEEKMPNVVISQFFALGVLAPWLLLLVLVSSLSAAMSFIILLPTHIDALFIFFRDVVGRLGSQRQ